MVTRGGRRRIRPNTPGQDGVLDQLGRDDAGDRDDLDPARADRHSEWVCPPFRERRRSLVTGPDRPRPTDPPG